MFNRPVAGRSSTCPFKGQRESWLLLMSRVTRHLYPTYPDSTTSSSIVPLQDAADLEFINPPLNLSVSLDTLRPGGEHELAR